MTSWSLATVVLLAGGLVPAVMLAGRGTSSDRLVGMELAGSVATAVLLLMCADDAQSMYLIVPMTLAVLSLAGALVYVRQLAPHRR